MKGRKVGEQRKLIIASGVEVATSYVLNQGKAKAKAKDYLNIITEYCLRKVGTYIQD